MEQDSILAIIQFHSWNPLQFEANSSSDSSQGIWKKKGGFPTEVKHQWTSQKAKISEDHTKEGDRGFLREVIQLQNKRNGFYFSWRLTIQTGFVILKLKPDTHQSVRLHSETQLSQYRATFSSQQWFWSFWFILDSGRDRAIIHITSKMVPETELGLD